MSVTAHTQFKLDYDPSNPFTVLPIINPHEWQLYKKHLACFWTVEEVDLSRDRDHWEHKLTDNERHFIKQILAFFAASDGIVSENLDLNFTQEVNIKEVRYFYRFQGMIEDIHNEMYSIMIDTFIADKKEKANALNAINTIPCVREKAQWALKWTKSSEASLPARILAFCAVEGIFFSGAFCAIFWLKQKNLMPGLTLSNEFISRDEGLHTEFGINLYNKCLQRLDIQKAHELVREAVVIEKAFICDSIPCALIGMNATMMSQYIEYVADRLLAQIKYPKIFNVSNPFDFMENISIEGKTNFFEERVSSYSKAGVGVNQEEQTFDLNADF